MKIDAALTASSLEPDLRRFWELSSEKIDLINSDFDSSLGSPVFTIKGRYTARGWTEWTQGFVFGSQLLQYDATGDERFVEEGKRNTMKFMAPHLTHTGVHDHGFNNISSYGNLLRLMEEGKLEHNNWEKDFYRLALKTSAAVQAMRWTKINNGGFIYSFNGPHSLFVDTLRTVRSLMVGHVLGHHLMTENDEPINLLDRGAAHLLSTARYNVYYGDGRDRYDVPGRTTHESVFNCNDGNYRCPNSQQGFSPFTTWTRGLAWAILGFAEELEFLESIDDDAFETVDPVHLKSALLKAVLVTSDYYLAITASDGIPYWDTGAPGLHALGDYTARPADPFNDYEPVDSSAACIAAQGLLRLANYLESADPRLAAKYKQAALTVTKTILQEPYLSTAADHQGLILHSVYHRPNGWDFIPSGKKVPCGESSMWGDYHARELMLMITRSLNNAPYFKFWPESI